LKYIKYSSLIAILAVLIVSCEKDDSSVIDPILKFPVIDTASITPNVFDTSSVTAAAIAKVTSEEPVANVNVTVKNPDGVGVGEYELRDDGVAPDITAGDGLYSGYITFSMSCRLVGLYQGTFLARNVSGLYSATNNVPFSVINSQNVKPALSNLIAPDSLRKPTSGQEVVFLRVTASDPNGLCDLSTVFFNSFIPPFGNPSSENPFTMYDDGDSVSFHCDAISNDGNYSLCVQFPASAFLGTYVFKFNARDRSDALSDTLTHNLYVYQ
jgi:hypothetical protein